jgi:hypothetical protein
MFGKEVLELDDCTLMGSGSKKINDYILGRRRNLFVTYGDGRGQVYRPAVKLTK